MKYYDVVIVGAGQAGIAMGYYLMKTDLSFILLDRDSNIGNSWTKRYDSLVLFTPRKYSALPNKKMKGNQHTFPTKDEIADYLKSYVSQFNIPIQMHTKVHFVHRENGYYVLNTSKGWLKAKQVVCATGAFDQPYIPPVIEKKNKEMNHYHSSEYKRPNQLPDGPVTVVGGGNSGAQIATELSKTKEVTLSVSENLTFLPLHFLNKDIFTWLDRTGFLFAGTDTKRGKWFQKREDPIFGKTLKKLLKQKKIKLKPRVIHTTGNLITFQDGTIQQSSSIIWATGFKANDSWIQIDNAISEEGKPIHDRGVSPIKGLYFIGLSWQYHRGSALICGVGRDASYIASWIQKESELNN